VVEETFPVTGGSIYC